MSLRVWLLPALALRATLGATVETPDMAEMMEMMEKLPPEEREQMMQMAQQMGGAGGPPGMSGPDLRAEAPPPPPKPMTLQRARSMMKELRAALTTAAARQAFAAVEGEGNDRAEKRGPLADKFAQSVFEKYGFEVGAQGGLSEAVRSAMASGDGHGQHDRKIRTAMEDIEEAITGRPTKQRLGRLPALDALAGKFLDMDAASRAAALKEVQGTTGGEAYAEIMTRVLQHGDGVVVDEVVELADVASLALSGPEQQIQPDVAIRMNVLREFVRLADHKQIQERLQAQQEKTKARRKKKKRKAAARRTDL